MESKSVTPVFEPDNIHYVSVTGDHKNDGSLHSPWNLEYAARGAGGRVKPGHTVLVQGGTYRSAAGFHITISGSATDKITFKADPNVPVILDGSIAAFTASGNQAWAPYGTTSTKHVYRSVENKFAAPKATFYGGFLQIDGQWYSLAPHKALSYLLSNDHKWHDPKVKVVPRYLGPGISQQDGYLYIRLDNSEAEAQLGRPVPQISDSDPRNHELYLCRSDSFGLKITGSHLVIEGFAQIDHFGGCIYMGTVGQSDITLRNCGGRPIYFGVRCGYVDQFIVDSCKFYAHMPSDTWWVAYEDIKGAKNPRDKAFAGEPPADNVRKVALDLGHAKNVKIFDSVFDEFFDGILASASKIEHDQVKIQASHNVEVHRNIFNHIWDDAWQMVGDLYQINFHHNYCFGAGPSVYSPGTDRPNPDPGTVFIHHNVIDTTTRLLFWGRAGAPIPDMYESIPLSSHGPPKKYTWPRKIYHNTILTGHKPDRNHPYVGWSTPAARNHDLISDAPHEVYNNIFVVLDGRAGGQDFDATTGHEIYDGNVYWNYETHPPEKKKTPWPRVWISTSEKAVTDLLTVRDLWAKTLPDVKKYYPPGWEASGLSENPLLDRDYRPRAESCTKGAVPLGGKGWPWTDHDEHWRGAIDPSSEKPPFPA